jgi:hypothetical protein
MLTAGAERMYQYCKYANVVWYIARLGGRTQVHVYYHCPKTKLRAINVVDSKTLKSSYVSNTTIEWWWFWCEGINENKYENNENAKERDSALTLHCYRHIR